MKVLNIIVAFEWSFETQGAIRACPSLDVERLTFRPTTVTCIDSRGMVRSSTELP